MFYTLCQYGRRVCNKRVYIYGNRLNETFRMMGHSLLLNNVNFVEVGFEW